MRTRGQGGLKVYTQEDIVEQYGVVKGSYDGVPLPKIKAYTVGAGWEAGSAAGWAGPIASGILRCGHHNWLL